MKKFSELVKKSKKQILKEMAYCDELLEIIDNQDEFTRSDLQGAVQAIVHKIILETKAKKA